MWPKFGNSSCSMKEVIKISTLHVFDQKNQIFKGCSCFKSTNLGLTQGMALKFKPVWKKG